MEIIRNNFNQACLMLIIKTKNTSRATLSLLADLMPLPQFSSVRPIRICVHRKWVTKQKLNKRRVARQGQLGTTHQQRLESDFSNIQTTVYIRNHGHVRPPHSLISYHGNPLDHVEIRSHSLPPSPRGFFERRFLSSNPDKHRFCKDRGVRTAVGPFSVNFSGDFLFKSSLVNYILL